MQIMMDEWINGWMDGSGGYMLMDGWMDGSVCLLFSEFCTNITLLQTRKKAKANPIPSV